MRFTKLTRPTESREALVAKLKEALTRADAVLIGAGAGLSTSAGFTYSGGRFETYFSDFAEQYGFADMYSGGFYPYETLEEHWAYWSRYIMVNRYMDPPRPVYADLLALVREKDYFVLTTNVDHCFQKAGFAKERLFYTQGDYGLFQCSAGTTPICKTSTYDNESAVREMYERQKDRRIPAELVPRCPICHKPMSMNLRADSTFVQDKGWDAAAARYEAYLASHADKHILLLELGVGGNTPGIIKYPFWQLAARNADATYACINYGEAVCPQEIASRSICIDADIGQVLSALS